MFASASNRSGWCRPIDDDAKPPIEMPIIAVHENRSVTGVPASAFATT